MFNTSLFLSHVNPIGYFQSGSEKSAPGSQIGTQADEASPILNTWLLWSFSAMRRVRRREEIWHIGDLCSPRLMWCTCWLPQSMVRGAVTAAASESFYKSSCANLIPDLPNQDLHFSMIPTWMIFILIFEKQCFR